MIYQQIEKHGLSASEKFLGVYNDGFEEINPGGLEDYDMQDGMIFQSCEKEDVCFIYRRGRGLIFISKEEFSRRRLELNTQQGEKDTETLSL